MRLPYELNGPEMLCDFLIEQGKQGHFYFITAHISEHDLEVGKRTDRPIIDKEYLFEEMEKIFKNFNKDNHQGKVVIVVDDEVLWHKIVSKHIKTKYPFLEVLSFISAKEVIELLKKRPLKSYPLAYFVD